MSRTLCASRPAYIVDGHEALALEFRSARWAHHRLLDFERKHQRIMDRAQRWIVPDLHRVARILARISKRGSHSGWKPGLQARMKALRDARNAHPLWVAAKRWADTPSPRAPVVVRRRKAGETDEAFAARVAQGKRRSRRDQHCVEVLYPQIRCHSSTYTALRAAVKQAVGKAIAERSKGSSASWRRPKYSDPITITSLSFTVVARRHPWWTLEFRVGRPSAIVQIRAKLGDWHELPPDVALLRLQLTKRGDRLSLSVTCGEMPDEDFPGGGVVALDWGHREHGHDRQGEGIRAFCWRGDDGRTGEILLPAECRIQLDRMHAVQSRLDQAWDARAATLGLHCKSRRQGYRASLMRSGVRTEDETLWLRWERNQERMIEAARRRVYALRKETYMKAVRALRRRYRVFVAEDIQGEALKAKAKEEEGARRKRENRDLTARFDFVSIAARKGAEVLKVNARNSTRECPACGFLRPKTSDVLLACGGCGRVSDRDHDAPITLLRRGLAALAAQVQT